MEDYVPDTPRKQGTMQDSSVMDTINEGTESGSSPDFGETVATVPIQRPQPHSPMQTYTPTTQKYTQELTQPTQIIERSSPHTGSSPAQNPAVVQVPSSSPNAPKSATSSVFCAPVPKPGALSNSIAPNGTSFRPPVMTRPPVKKSPVVDFDNDDGPTYPGGSSDDDIQSAGTTDIKPSTFVKSSRNTDKERVPESPAGADNVNSRFKEITAAAVYNPAADNHAGKRPADSMVSTDRNNERSPKRARGDICMDSPLERQTALSSIGDYQARIKIERMLKVLPSKSVQECMQALVTKRGHYEDALNYLASSDDPKPTNALSDDELSIEHKAPSVAPAKQQIRTQSRIQDRWTSRQQVPRQRSSERSPSRPRGRRLIRGSKNRPRPSPTGSDNRSSPPAPKKQTKLIRGGKIRPRSPSASPPVIQTIDSDESDVGGDEPEQDDGTLTTKVLKFFNTCSIDDLMDIAEVSSDVANVLISSRPFSRLDTVREVSTGEETSKTSVKGRKVTRKPIGDKIVDKCLDMWTGYEAVDSLVSQCESLGKPVATQMKRWGVDIYGAKEDGELNLVSFDKSSEGTHDSGIGTPSSRRSSTVDGDEVKDSSRRKNQLIGQPSVMSENIKMKDYQIVGINWLNLLFEQNLSCILADDMGLGKTCQVIAFLAHLYETGVKGPHLVVVPSSTLENWLREFSIFCPKLTVMPYYAGQAARADIREQIEEERDNINVVITTYTIAKAHKDASFLRSLDFSVCVYDEGHMLKNSKSTVYDKLIRIPAQFRLLLTGTPLQNNLQELASLLGFILPSVFKERKEDLEYIFSAKAKTVDDTHSALLSAQRIARAKSMLTPFVLRRKKHQVIDLPRKTAHVGYCEMNAAQREIYTHETETVKQLIADREAGKKTGTKSANILMKLRQAAIHPLFFRRLYSNETLSRIAKACLKDPKWALSDPDQIYEELQAYNDFEVHTLCAKNPTALSKFTLKNEEWMMSGKVDKLCELLRRFKDNGDRTLVFSQFTMVMDILENVLESLRIGFFRLDGTTSVEDRQSTLDAFHENTEIPVFLLSTKAGGAGINLACANKVIIFDSSFNPQDDIQAENRAHRVGQTREVEVIRLVMKETIEEQIYALGQTKLALDQRVAGDDDGAAGGKKNEEAGMKVVEDMMVADIEKEKQK